jgi:hypothetical protein
VTAPAPPTQEVILQRESVNRCLRLVARAFGVATDPNQPIVDPEEVRRHDEQFERDNPNWDQQHGGRR